jgi:hypothetical protein
VIFSAHADFLQAAFAQIEQEYGGIDTFLDRHGIDAAMRSKVKATLLAA